MATNLLRGLLGGDEELTPQTQARNAGLLSAGLQMLAGSGPSRTPQSVGQSLGVAGMAGMQSYQGALQQAEAAQMAKELQSGLTGGDVSSVANRYREYAARLGATDPQRAKLYMDLAEKMEGKSEKFSGNLANASLELFGTADIGKLTAEQRKQAADYYQRREMDLAAARRSVQTVNVQPGVQVGSIPPGYALMKNEDGSMVMQPIPGGPAAKAEAEAQQAKETGSAVTRTAAQTVFEDADRAIKIVQESPRSATGLGAMVLQNIPATSARELRGHIESIKGNIGIDQLLKIKASGAGLGAIPQAQLEMLASLLGNLDGQQNSQVLLTNLQRVQEIYSDIVQKEGGDPRKMWEERQRRLGTTAPPGARPLNEIFR
jgi:hypothetical protein